MTPTPVRLEDYHPLPYLIDHVHLTFQLDPDRTVVQSVMSVRPSSHWDGTPLRLVGENLELISVTFGQEGLIPIIDNGYLVIPPFQSPTELTIVTAISPRKNTELDGLYWVNGTFCTQNEPEGFRKITYFLDRPDNLSTFTTTLIAPIEDYPSLLSNGNFVDTATYDDDTHSVTWHDPFPKPSYLYAVVGGKFDVIQDTFTTSSGRSVLLQIYSDPGYAGRCAYAMEALKRSMAWDEVAYGREYDLDRFMIVAIDSFNMGAMENKGLNIFNSAYILADPRTATDTDYMNIEGVVAHEYFHNWTGNRITCRDWFQLTLKEGLTVYRDQEFSADTNSRGVKRIGDVRLMKEVQFVEDAGPMSHPIQPKTYLEINNFYTSTVYNKGAEVIRMMALLAGKSGFRAGTDLYFARHDGQAVTTEDFIRAIEDGANIDLATFRRWYHQAGTPHVTVTPLVSDSQITGLQFEQTPPPNAEGKCLEPFVIPIVIAMVPPDAPPTSFQIDNSELAPENTVILDTPQKTVRLTPQPTTCVPSLLRGFSAPVHLDYPYTESDLVTILKNDTDPVTICDAAQRLYDSAILSQYQKNSPVVISDTFKSALNRLITDSTIDPAVAAICLQVPSISHLMDQVSDFAIEAIFTTQRRLIATLATEFSDELVTRYHTLTTTAPYAPSPDQIGARRLQNTLLSILSDTQVGGNLALIQFQTAQNMTDSFAALVAIINGAIDSDRRAHCVSEFFEQWKSEPLVINKWLAAQASGTHETTLATVQALTSHPIYNRLVPNQFRALVGTFSANMPHFHDRSGSGYHWVANQILELDPHNPQIAARIALSFQRTARCDIDRRRIVDEILTTILNRKTLSKNVFEVVSKIKGSYNLAQ